MITFCSMGSPYPANADNRDGQEVLTEYIISAQGATGGWGYGYDSDSSVEATSWTLYYLCGLHGAYPQVQKGIGFLLEVQNIDGGWGAYPDLPSGIQTALSIMALERCASSNPDPKIELAIKKGKGFLLSHREMGLEYGPDPHGGWAWIPGTYDFPESTAYGLMAVPHEVNTSEFGQFFESRRSADWGWDIEKRNTSRIIPTSVVLVGIKKAGVPIGNINKTLSLLEGMTEDRDTLLSLCWANYALKSHGRDTSELEDRIIGHLMNREKVDPYTLALCLTALEGMDE